MAQSSSAAREPSMEEILASIRKIIEDNDTGRPEAPHGAGAEVRPFPNAPGEMPDTVEDDEDLPIALNPVNVNEALRKPEVEPAPSARNGWQIEAELEAAGMRPTRAPALSGGIAQKGSESGRDAPSARPQPQQAATPARPAAPRQPSADAAAGSETPKPTPPTPAVSSTSASALVSATTVKQVSTAFEDLTHAVSAESRRTFDEIATDILRPMLQEWLDDNLPRLVERLVREEIERVVRGGRS